MGKDLGKIAGSLKAEAATFSEAMNESLAEAEKVRGQADRLPVSLSLCLPVSFSPLVLSHSLPLSPSALSPCLLRSLEPLSFPSVLSSLACAPVVSCRGSAGWEWSGDG